MLKKDVLGNASKKSLGEAFRCSECLHYKQVAHPSYEDVCFNLGVKPFGVAPSCFTPDVTKVVANPDQFVQLAALFSEWTPSQRRIVLGMLRTSTKKKKQYTFGMKVYFHTGKDFVSNYLYGLVIGYTSSGEVIISGPPDIKQRGKSYLAYMSPSDGLLTASEWKTKRKQLMDAGKIFDPASAVVKKSSIVAEYEPPSIDRAPTEPSTRKTKKRTVDTYEFQVS